MKCAKVREKILIEGILDPKVAKHVERCADCAIFADSLEKFSPAKPDVNSFDIPRFIDDRVKTESRNFLVERARRPLTENTRHADFASYFAMAATILLVSWLFVSLLIPKRDAGNASHLNGPGKEDRSASTPISLSWNDKCIENDFFTIDTDIEFTFALMNVSPDDDSENSEDPMEDSRFKVYIPEILT
ncbi:MAG: hypothetical protein GXP32_07030 [Kiritimatiellaeota bacterium]|nr:hypothetical protein [Kiritimatiellota bacterium]